MRTYIAVLAMTACASVAFGALGTGNGLPRSWDLANTSGYDAVNAISRNPASTMCVACHQTNPSAHILDIESQGTGVDNTAPNRGSHFVMNRDAGGIGSTHSGGGYGSSVGNAARDGGQFFRGAIWASGGYSKFRSGAGLNTVNELASGFDVANADMICESCHNLIQNTANNLTDNDLLLGVYSDNDQDGICVGCHAQNETDRTAFHANSNIKNFGGSLRKYHHVLAGDTITVSTDYAKDLANVQRWAPSFTQILGQGWCTPANKYNTGARGTVPSPDISGLDAITPAFRNACNIAGSGTRANTIPQTLGDIRIVNATASGITCSSCHRPHNAKTNSGAHIFRMGDYASAPVGSGASLTSDYAVKSTWVAPNLGLARNADVSGLVYTEYRALCLGCHVGY